MYANEGDMKLLRYCAKVYARDAASPLFQWPVDPGNLEFAVSVLETCLQFYRARGVARRPSDKRRDTDAESVLKHPPVGPDGVIAIAGALAHVIRVMDDTVADIEGRRPFFVPSAAKEKRVVASFATVQRMMADLNQPTYALRGNDILVAVDAVEAVQKRVREANLSFIVKGAFGGPFEIDRK